MSSIDESRSESSPDSGAPSSPPPPLKNLRRDPNREKVPPFDYDNMEVGSLREMFPRQYLPAELDPIWVDMPLNDIPLCWFGAPLLLPNIIKYAKEYAFDCPATTPHLAWIPGAVDEGKCWYNICKYFYRQTGINMRIKDVWNQRLPVIVFWSNRELVNVEDVMFRQVGMLLRDMEYEKKYSPRWYLDRGQEP